MAALEYAPYITLAVYDDIDPGRLRTVPAEAITGASELRLTCIGPRFFDNVPLVLWADPSALQRPAWQQGHQHPSQMPRTRRRSISRSIRSNSPSATESIEEKSLCGLAKTSRSS